MNHEYIPLYVPLTLDGICNYIDILKLSYSLNSTHKSNNGYIGVSDGRFAYKNTICFMDKEPSTESLIHLKNTLIITSDKFKTYFDEHITIITDDPRYLFIKLLALFKQKKMFTPFSSYIDKQTPYISPNAIIDPKAIIEEGVSIGEGSIISAGTIIKKGSYIANGCIIRENCTIGCDGISLYKCREGAIRFPHIAGVYIGNNVEIGANCVIVKGTLLNTEIKEESVIGNLCNIGHGVKIGKRFWMSVGSHIGGNCTIGDHTTIGLGVNIKNNLFIGKNVSIGMGSVVTKNLTENISVFGNPAKKMRSLSTGPQR